HFEKYPLITKKRSDYELFKQVVDLLNRKEHLTLDGLKKIVSLRASINNGLSPKLKEAFPDTIPVQRPIVADQDITNSYWLAGFTSGEGCFHVNIYKSLTNLGEAVKLKFELAQHYRDAELLTSLNKYLGCGGVYKHSENVVVFIVTRFS